MLISLLSNLGSIDIMTVIIYILSTLVVVFLVLPFHEWAHGFVAYKLGDNTAKIRGRLTLNPLAHIDPFGSMLLLLIGFGWAKPVPVEPRNFKNEKQGMAITALAGPAANLLAAMVAGLLMHTLIAILTAAGVVVSVGSVFYISAGGSFWAYVIRFFMYLMLINISLAVFNFIPIPPLDGSKILMAFLPDSAVDWLYAHEQIFSIGLFILVMAGGLRGGIITAIQSTLYNFIDWLTALPFSFA